MLLYMKNAFLLAVTAFMVLPGLSQSLTYFGQQPPGDTPRLFAPGFISKADRYELMAAYAPDAKEFCFTVTNEHWSHFEIWHTLFDGSAWTEPRRMPFSDTMQCFGPAFTADNGRLFFSSANWVTHPATIWYSNRLPGGWGIPVKADSLLNAGADQWQCTVARDGTLVFASKRQGGKGEYDLYMTEPGGEPMNLAELNSPADEYSALNKWSDIYWVRIDGIIKRLRKQALF